MAWWLLRWFGHPLRYRRRGKEPPLYFLRCSTGVGTIPETIPLATAKAIVWCDAAWAAVTIPFVFMVEISRTGELAAIGVAYVVLGFSVVQYLGIRRIRAESS